MQVVVGVQEDLGRRVEVAVIGERDSARLDHVAELASSWPFWPFVTAPMMRMWTLATSSARFWRLRTMSAASTTGFVFGIVATVV